MSETKSCPTCWFYSAARWYREQLDVAEHNQTRNAREYARLCHENVKLRELVDYMTPIAWYAASERERDRMYELGVEV